MSSWADSGFAEQIAISAPRLFAAIARTDFGLIQRNLDDIVARANSIASLEPYSTEYNTGMYDMHASIEDIEKHLVDATPYLYVSFTNIMLSAVWIAIILALFAIMRRGRAKYRQEYESQ